MAIRFFTENTSFNLKKKRKIAYWLKSVANEEGKTIDSINYVFVSEEVIIELNKKYLDHNYSTDIITFDNSESVTRLSGEMYISVDTVVKNANYYKEDFDKELKRVMVHGLLHLCGYTDKTKKDIEKIRKIEDKYLKRYDTIAEI